MLETNTEEADRSLLLLLLLPTFPCHLINSATSQDPHHFEQFVFMPFAACKVGAEEGGTCLFPERKHPPAGGGHNRKQLGRVLRQLRSQHPSCLQLSCCIWTTRLLTLSLPTDNFVELKRQSILYTFPPRFSSQKTSMG